MGRIIEFDRKVKELFYRVRTLNNSNDDLSRSLAITKAQIILSEYAYDMHNMNEHSVSQFCKVLITLLSKLDEG